MKKAKEFMKSTKFKIILLIFVLMAGFMARSGLEQLYKEQSAKKTEVNMYDDGTRVGRELQYAENVSEDNKILKVFQKEFETATVISAFEEDLTDDGLKDLIVIYSTPEADENSKYTELVNGGHIRLVVMIDSGDGINYSHTEPIPAPVENQQIQFQNIDDAEQIEFVLQGQKGSKIGYGIFRVVDNETVNLFGDGLEEC